MTARIGATIERADAIITISRFSAREIVEFFPAAKGKVFPIYLGVDQSLASPGRATMIVNRIRAADEIPADLDGMLIDPIELDVCDAETMPLAALLYQGGYLTIKDVDAEDGTVSLGIPNKEISKSLHEGFLRSVLGRSMENWNDKLIHSRRELRAKRESSRC